MGLANIRGDYCFASSAIHENNIRPKTFRTFLIFFKVLTNCWMILLFDITLELKKPISHDFFPNNHGLKQNTSKLK